MGMWGRSVEEGKLFEPKPDVSLMAPRATVHVIDPGGTREKLLDPARRDSKEQGHE